MIDAPALPFRPSLRLSIGMNASAWLGWIAKPAATLVLLSVAFPFAALAGRPLYGDIFWMLAYGRFMFENGGLPLADPFSFAPHAENYFHVQWLAHVAVAAVERSTGLEGVMLFNAAIGAITFGLLLHLAYVRSRNIVAAAVATLLAEFLAMGFLYPRAQTMATLPFVATWWLLTCGGNRLSTLLGLAVLEAVWANVHGSFFIGPLMTGMVLAGLIGDTLIRDMRQWRTLVRNRRVQFLTLALAAQVLATLANPYGPGLYAYLSNMSSDPVVRGWVTEWLPTSTAEPAGSVFFVSVAVMFVVLGLAGWRVAVADALIIGVFAVFALTAVRNVPWWALACGPIFAAYAVRIPLSPRVAALGQAFAIRRPRLKSGLIRFGLIVAIVISCLPSVRPHVTLLPADVRVIVDDDYPIAASDFLEAHNLGPRVFNWQAWGAYIDWRLWPRYQPILDSAIEVHPTEVWEEVRLIVRGHASWEELLDKYAVDVLLLQNVAGDPLIQAVDRSSRWKLVHEDDIAVVYTRAAAAEALS